MAKKYWYIVEIDSNLCFNSTHQKPSTKCDCFVDGFGKADSEKSFNIKSFHKV